MGLPKGKQNDMTPPDILTGLRKVETLKEEKLMGRLSITWSNSHQKFLDEILSKALKNGDLIISADGNFSFSEKFYEDDATKDFITNIPSDIMNDMVLAWIDKQLQSGAL